jgi:hypothetical protein
MSTIDKAKAAVSEFMHKAGHHDTTVHEEVAPAVVKETIKKTEHREVQPAVDVEIHKHHYHTSYQPVLAKEVLPEQHIHQVAPVQERVIEKGNDEEIRRRLEAERIRLQNERVEAPTVTTQSTAPVVRGEHIHHHVHETIQPILQKEVIQPTVVHTTVPIHEIVNEKVVHAASQLPPVTVDEFQRQGGRLSGREERIDGFEGEPKAIGAALGGTPVTSSSVPLTGGHHSTTGTHSGLGHHNTTGTTHSSKHHGGLLAKLDPRVDSDGDGRRGIGE